MKANKNLFIQGSISDSDIDNLKVEFNQTDFEILKYYDLSSTTFESLRIIFNDFNLISFTRDFVLSSLLTNTLESIQKIVASLRKKNRKVDSITINISVSKSNEQTLNLKLNAETDKFALLIEQTEKCLTVELNNVPKNITSFNISLDSENNIKILKL